MEPEQGTPQESATGIREEDRTMAMLCHLSGIVGSFFFPFGNIIAPLIIWQVKKEGSPYLDYHGREAVNFQISFTIYMVIALLLCLVLIGFVLAPIIGIGGLVLMIIAAIKAKDGIEYRYPMIFRLL